MTQLATNLERVDSVSGICQRMIYFCTHRCECKSRIVFSNIYSKLCIIYKNLNQMNEIDTQQKIFKYSIDFILLWKNDLPIDAAKSFSLSREELCRTMLTNNIHTTNLYSFIVLYTYIVRNKTHSSGQVWLRWWYMRLRLMVRGQKAWIMAPSKNII